METIFDAFHKVFSVQILSPTSSYLRIFLYLLLELAFLSQNIQFFWFPGFPVQGWASYEPFWNTINWLSIDVLAANFYYISVFINFEYAFISTITSVIFLLMVLEIFGKNLPKWLLIVTRIMFTLACDFCFIPTNILFQVILKYSTSHEQIVQEYPNMIPGSYVDFGRGGQVLGISVLVITWILTIIYEICRYEIRNQGKNGLQEAKISCKGNLVIKVLYGINSCLFTNLQLSDYPAYLYICSISV
jgi:hypothetical protein